MPGFLGHQIVAFPLMVYFAFVGIQGWCFRDADGDGAAATLDGRLFARNPAGELLAQLTIGMMVFWDIPTNALIPSLRDGVLMAHHVGMTLAMYVCLSPFLQHYVRAAATPPPAPQATCPHARSAAPGAPVRSE
eukprot:518317-Prymnesium_polylepis.1